MKSVNVCVLVLDMQLPDEPSSVQHTSNNVSRWSLNIIYSIFVLLTALKTNEMMCVCFKVLKTDDVIYADICFSAGSEGVCVHECESTEYACVRYN